ncbi:carbonic anhydrase-like [Uloborus diversus]|uniref:carbonic anhydrase-like n=1 Tax=Uloborus diversus TaxID=327109 RepID=UPI002409EAB6|nr:carbonic anhydrase-like [Uloborus diversus]
MVSGDRDDRRSAQKEKCPADAREEWSYNGLNGPQYWGKTFRQCNGRRQSPVNIKYEDVIEDPYLKKLSFKNYSKPISRARVRNTGRTVEITPQDGVQRSIEANGELFTLQDLHFHWGTDKNKGSEHATNGVLYAMELHLVHRNRKNEVAVVAVIMEEYSSDNRDLKLVVDTLPRLQYKNYSTNLASGFKLSNLLPSNPATFYRYEGSLTTPRCDEGVIWSVLKKRISIGKSQITKFRQLKSADDSRENVNCTLVNNYRSVQSLNGRKIFLSN